jgi:hypothetical protein
MMESPGHFAFCSPSLHVFDPLEKRYRSVPHGSFHDMEELSVMVKTWQLA